MSVQPIRAKASSARIERSAAQLVEAKAIRVPAFEMLKQLIVSGNALVHMPKDGGMKVFRLDSYCVKRDTMGNLLKIVVKETIAFIVLKWLAE